MVRIKKGCYYQGSDKQLACSEKSNLFAQIPIVSHSEFDMYKESAIDGVDWIYLFSFLVQNTQSISDTDFQMVSRFVVFPGG